MLSILSLSGKIILRFFRFFLPVCTFTRKIHHHDMKKSFLIKSSSLCYPSLLYDVNAKSVSDKVSINQRLLQKLFPISPLSRERFSGEEEQLNLIWKQIFFFNFRWHKITIKHFSKTAQVVIVLEVYVAEILSFPEPYALK